MFQKFVDILKSLLHHADFVFFCPFLAIFVCFHLQVWALKNPGPKKAVHGKVSVRETAKLLQKKQEPGTEVVKFSIFSASQEVVDKQS